MTDRITVTPRELDIVEGLASGLTWSAVGTSVGMTMENVKSAAKPLYRKLGAASAAQAVARLYEAGLLPRRGKRRMRITLELTEVDARNLDAMCTEGFRKLRDDCTEEVRAMARAVLYRVQEAIAIGQRQLLELPDVNA